ncbi:MAG TPA: adenylyl-sulfate kinase [Nitrospirales bacterium]|nr:adenylyl-sulfate kinase [Nitrospirales bacterium]
MEKNIRSPVLGPRRSRGMQSKGFTIWLTGLPGAGKTTLAQLLGEEFRAIDHPVEILDGDEIRQRFTNDLGFTREDRDENIRRIAVVAKQLTRIGSIVIVAAISPYARARRDARMKIGNFVEVFVQCPLEICIQRDPKGLYAKAKRGEVVQLTGLSDPYEEPTTPDVIVHTNRETPRQSLVKIFQYLFTKNFVHAPQELRG